MSFTSRKVVSIGEAMIEFAPVEGGTYRRGFAGDTFNTAWHMAQILGARADVGFVTRVGCDAISDAFVGSLMADGVDTKGISRDATRTMGLYMIALDGHERSFHYWRGMSAAKGLADDRGALVTAVQGAALVHLSGITLAILSPVARDVLFEVLSEARAGGTVVSFDPNIRRGLWATEADIRDTVGRMLALTDIALPSFDDETTYWQDATPQATVARFAAAGAREILVKNGAGAIVYQAGRGSMYEIATPTVDAIKDTTGAGDAFNAGYLAARLVGLPVGQAVAIGQKLAAEVICTFGAQADGGRVRAMRLLDDRPGAAVQGSGQTGLTGDEFDG